MDPVERRMVAVSTGVVRAPDGTMAVLFQIPDGYVLMGPADARMLGDRLHEAAAEIDGGP